MTDAKAALPAILHRDLGTCADCKTWVGASGSAHDPADCSGLRSSIARQERVVQEAQARLDSLRRTLASGDEVSS